MKMHFLIFFMSLFKFVMNRKHMLLMFLSLEFIILSLLYKCLYIFQILEMSIFSMLFLSFSVCESVFGLSLLVFLIRSHGSDYFNLFNLLW